MHSNNARHSIAAGSPAVAALLINSIARCQPPEAAEAFFLLLVFIGHLGHMAPAPCARKRVDRRRSRRHRRALPDKVLP
jgi:hypothetical protein